MAKYYLGKFENGQYIPIKLNDVGTSILDVINYTASFPTVDELREFLLLTGDLQYFTDELVYLMEAGDKKNKKYEVIPMGANIIDISNKKYFDKNYIYEYLFKNMYNQDFYSSLMFYYIRKLKLDKTIENGIMNLINNPTRLLDFAAKKKYLNDEAKVVIDKLEESFTKRDYQGMHNSLVSLNSAIQKDKNNLITAYYFFSPSMKKQYTGIVNKIDNAYRVIRRANNMGIDMYIQDPDEDHNLQTYITEIYNSLIFYYDSAKKNYKTDENGKKKVNKRNIYELGMLISMFEEYKRQQYEHENPKIVEYDDEHEEFLEEEDFRNLHTTSEREGYTLRKRDGDKY